MEEQQKTLEDLFLYWYGLDKNLNLDNKTISNIDLPESHVEHLWKNIWFAKNEQQSNIDKELLEYKYLFDLYDPESSSIEDILSKLNLFSRIGLIILYDQISRNIFRKTEIAYKYDKSARDLAQNYINSYKEYPIHIIITIIMTLIHSESIDDQIQAGEIIIFLKEKYKSKNNLIIRQLSLIHHNHYDRIKLFGRIPERCLYLNRPMTDEERIYLDNIY